MWRRVLKNNPRYRATLLLDDDWAQLSSSKTVHFILQRHPRPGGCRCTRGYGKVRVCVCARDQSISSQFIDMLSQSVRGLGERKKVFDYLPQEVVRKCLIIV